MTGRRAKLILILIGVVVAALVLASWTQNWFTLAVTGIGPVPIDGGVAAPALTALALAELVLLGALAIAGPFFRVVLSVLQVLIGIAILWSSIAAIADPVTASAASVTKATGIAGQISVDALVTGGVGETAWPWFAALGGGLLIVLAVFFVLTSRTWPGSGRKYQRNRVAPIDAERTAVDDWDSLSVGDDPTS